MEDRSVQWKSFSSSLSFKESRMINNLTQSTLLRIVALNKIIVVQHNFVSSFQTTFFINFSFFLRRNIDEIFLEEIERYQKPTNNSIKIQNYVIICIKNYIGSCAKNYYKIIFSTDSPKPQLYYYWLVYYCAIVYSTPLHKF